MSMLLMTGMMLCSCEKDETTDGTGNSVDLKRDLVCRYTFDDGQPNDVSGHGYHGTISGKIKAVTDTPSGKGYALSIDGTSQQFINIPYAMIGDSTNFTVSIWVKDFGTGCIFSGVNGNSIGSPALWVTSDCHPKFYTGYDTNTSSISIEHLQSGVWHNIILAASRKQGKAMLYIDGKLFDTFNPRYIEPEGNKMQIGGNADGGFDFWADPMLVDNFRVYRRCINEKEAVEIFTSER